MELTPKIQKAIEVATIAHLGMVRKGDDLPYIIHPFSVAWILAGYTDDEDVAVAGLLHDILEDVPKEKYSAEDIRRDFGDKVLEIVRGVSEDKDSSITREEEKRSWQERKEKYIENLRSDSQESLMVSAADKIHNLRSMMAAYETQGEKLWEKFNASKKEILWYQEAVLEVMKSRLKSGIVSELEKTIQEAIKKFK